MSLDKKEIRYEGKCLDRYIKDHRFRIKTFQGERIQKSELIVEDIPPYFPSPELIEAVEYARILRRPLLIRGEPGCGKTRLAQAIAFEIYEENYRDHYFEWYIKSTTKAVDGLYTFDHLRRLRDVQLKKKDIDTLQYRSLGPLGKAFVQSTEKHPSVLLIDEIDKADIDFPNDLLLELDQRRFFIDETGENIVAEYPPIIIITSNDEKELPNAFLRRCVFHYIEFPQEEQLLRIARAKIQTLEEEARTKTQAFPESLLDDVVKRFRKLYEDMKKNPNTSKSPSTSELLDWLQVIHYYFISSKLPFEKYEENKKEKYRLKSEVLYYPELLLKTLDDYQLQVNKNKDK